VFGNFDSLLRVWLPAQAARQFVQAVQEKVHNVESVLVFQGDNKRVCWAFGGRKEAWEHNQATLEQAVQNLTAEEVRLVQDQRDLAAINRWKNAGLLYPRSKASGSSDGKIKAFIAFSEPHRGVSIAARAQTLRKLEDLLLDRQRGFDEVTLIDGLGFCWVLGKIVSTDFYSFGRLVADTAQEFGPLGIGSSTFLVTGENAAEGDVISTVALELSSGHDPRVAAFLPALYEAQQPPLTRVETARFEQFVLHKVFDGRIQGDQLPPADQAALKNFLTAAVSNSRENAFVALYPRIITAEGQLRRDIGELAGRFYPGKLSALLQKLSDADQGLEKTKDRLTLIDVLRAAKFLLREQFPHDPFIAGLEKEEGFKEASNLRNTVMHDKPFDPRDDWERFAQAALHLFYLREGIENRYRQLMRSAGKTTEQEDKL
jgi:hypothetical protein